jgi:hypothetical protein
MNTLKRKVAKVKSQTKTYIHRSNNFVTLSQKVTNVTHRKGGSNGKYSLHATLLEDIETIQIEELLQSVQIRRSLSMSKLPISFPFSKIFRKNIPYTIGKLIW